MKNLLVAQSGGPTAAINSTLIGVLTYVLIKKVGDSSYSFVCVVVGFMLWLVVSWFLLLFVDGV